MNKKNFILLFLCFPVFLFGQEIITDLGSNPQIKAYLKTHPGYSTAKTQKLVLDTLPVIDDFSGRSIFPDSSIWTDHHVFVNNNYPYLPPTVGVATFDALNDTGALYSVANAYGFVADTLTSKYVRLDSVLGINPSSLKIKDSIYFSFLYQPQGIGNAPEEEDSLVLEFYSPATGEWNHVWASEGSTLSAFHNKYNVWFKQVMIPITDSVSYFQNGFRFRFYNYASLTNNSQPTWAGNVDQWNLDYVYLGKGRNMGDSIFNDVAFVQPAPSVLKKYSSMPWNQYLFNPSAELKDSLYMFMRNLDSLDIQISYYYNVYDESGSLIPDPDPITPPTYDAGKTNIYALSLNQFSTHELLFKFPHVHFVLPASTADSASFKIIHVLQETSSQDIRRSNDTTIFEQKFYNYYAYDDGTPEAGYGLSPAHSKLAYRFTLNQPDTLRAIKMFFNQTYNNASQKYFYLTIWADNNQKPGNILYQKTGMKPLYEDSLNEFHTYKLDTALYLSGTFYVGWEQLDDSNLNLGYDKNTDAKSNILYNTAGSWLTSSYAGALMIRPVFGKNFSLAGIHESETQQVQFSVYPNPVNGEVLHLSTKESFDHSNIAITIFDIYGKCVLNLPYAESINISGLSEGMYFLRFSQNSRLLSITKKFVIIK